LSGGRSNPANCRKSVQLALDFALGKKGEELFKNKKIRWNFQHLFIAGYSFAGNIILSSKVDKKVSGIILYAPLIFIHNNDIKKILPSSERRDFEHSNKAKLAFFRRGFSNSWRGIENEKWDAFFLGKDAASEIKLSGNFPKLIVYHGTLDREVDPKFSRYFEKEFGIQVHFVSDAPHTKELLSLEHFSNF
jgi:hypothetical protein